MSVEFTAFARRADHRPALQKLLQTLLRTYHSMLSSLLIPPRRDQHTEPEWHRQVEWIRLVATNMISAVNELRPMQVRELPTLRERARADHTDKQSILSCHLPWFLFLISSPPPLRPDSGPRNPRTQPSHTTGNPPAGDDKNSLVRLDELPGQTIQLISYLTVDVAMQ